MTPAQQLAKEKPRKRPPRNRATTMRELIWKCNLRSLRDGLNLGIKDVALHAGITVSSLFHLEHGTEPCLTTALKLCNFYGKAIEEIWPKNVKDVGWPVASRK